MADGGGRYILLTDKNELATVNESLSHAPVRKLGELSVSHSHIHTGKRCIHIKILGNVFKLFSKLALHVCPVLCDTRAIYPQNFCV